MNDRGFIALASVLILGAVALLIALGASTRSLAQSDISVAATSATEALALADSCAEHALYQLRLDPLYAGGETLTIGEDSCRIDTIVSTRTTTRAVHAESAVSGYTKRLSVDADVLGDGDSVLLWREVPDP